MRLKDYPRTPTLTKENVFATDSVENGVKAISGNLLASQLLSFLDKDTLCAWYDEIKIPVYERRKIYRGKYLGDSVSLLQQARIRNGTFEDMFIGDYWTINGRSYVIFDFDYYMGSYSEGVTSPYTYVQDHHVTMTARYGTFPIRSVYSNSELATGGYLGSVIHTETFPNIVYPELEKAFGNHILQTSLCLTNSIGSDGSLVSNLWADLKVVLPTCKMIFGEDNICLCGVINQSETEQLAYYRIVGSASFTDAWLRDLSDNENSAAAGKPVSAVNRLLQYNSPTTELTAVPIFNITYGSN